MAFVKLIIYIKINGSEVKEREKWANNVITYLDNNEDGGQDLAQQLKSDVRQTSTKSIKLNDKITYTNIMREGRDSTINTKGIGDLNWLTSLTSLSTADAILHKWKLVKIGE